MLSTRHGRMQLVHLTKSFRTMTAIRKDVRGNLRLRKEGYNVGVYAELCQGSFTPALLAASASWELCSFIFLHLLDFGIPGLDSKVCLNFSDFFLSFSATPVFTILLTLAKLDRTSPEAVLQASLAFSITDFSYVSQNLFSSNNQFYVNLK